MSRLDALAGRALEVTTGVANDRLRAVAVARSRLRRASEQVGGTRFSWRLIAILRFRIGTWW